MPAGVAQVQINGPIVAAPDANTPWPYTTLADVQSQLEWQSPYTSVSVTINSPGGNADEGFGIYDTLRTLPVPVTTEAVGQCSSIASIIFLAGSIRRAHKNLLYGVHFPFGGCSGTADEMQAYTDALRAMQDRLVAVYTERGTVTADVITPLLDSETYLTTEQLIAFGLATTIVEPVLALASFKPQVALTNATNLPADNPAAGFSQFMATVKKTLAQHMAEVKALLRGTPMQAMLHTTDAGASITIDHPEDRAPQAGDAANDADGNPLADGSYTLSDGAVLVVKDGKVDTYTAPATSSTADSQEREASTVDTQATPTTLEEATQIIQALRGSNRQASTTTGGQRQQSRYQREIEERLATIGSLVQSGGPPVEANDTNNRGNQGQSQSQERKAMTDPNSDEAKKAAAQRIQARRMKGSR